MKLYLGVEIYQFYFNKIIINMKKAPMRNLMEKLIIFFYVYFFFHFSSFLYWTHLNAILEAAAVTLWTERLLAILASPIRVPVISDPASCCCPWEATDDGPGARVPLLPRDPDLECLAHGLLLTQTWLSLQHMFDHSESPSSRPSSVPTSSFLLKWLQKLGPQEPRELLRQGSSYWSRPVLVLFFFPICF